MAFLLSFLLHVSDYGFSMLRRRKWQPTPVFLPGKSHGQRSLAGYSPWGHKESHTTERLNSNDQHPFELEKLFSFSSQGIHLNISLNIGMLLCCQTSISLIKTRF